MDIKEYYIRQISRTHNKGYENYVITRVITLLDDPTLKFVTQQAVKRRESGKRALTDLYFPQIDLHIEIDEGYHKAQREKDVERDADIVSVTSHDIRRIDASASLPDIHKQIYAVVADIRKRLQDRKNDRSFIPWDIEKEFDPAYYTQKGYIDIADKVAFRKMADACNCFGHSYTGYQRGSAVHLYESDARLWFPKLYENEDWDNQISDDDRTITERKKKIDAVPMRFDEIPWNGKRIFVFAHALDSLGKALYRFKGVFRFDMEETKKANVRTYRRIETRVKTYPPLTRQNYKDA